MRSSTAIALSAAALGASTLTAFAGPITTTDPGRHNTLGDAFEARIRLDGGNSQTWKAAFWNNNEMLDTSGNTRSTFGNGITESFSMTYDASTARASLSIAGLTTTSTIALEPGKELAGLRFFVVSERDTGTTMVRNMTVTRSSGSAEHIAGLTSGIGQRFVESSWYFFDSPTTTVAVTGDLTFGWNHNANLQGERFKLSILLLSGTPVPAPSAAALLGLGGTIAARRRR